MTSLPTILMLTGLATAVAAGDAKPLLHPLFSDHAVIQRDRPVTVWGWTTPGAEVEVALVGGAGKPARAVAAADGRWQAAIGPFPAGGPFTLVAKAGNQRMAANDVLVGEVWLCSGQSNMRRSVAEVGDYEAERVRSDLPQIRHLNPRQPQAATPQEMFPGRWKVTTPENVGAFTAVGFYMARALHADLKVPIGVVNCTLGGTNIENWMSLEALTACGAATTAPPVNPAVPDQQSIAPAGMFNGHIAAMVPMTLAGMAWYQGESNSGKAYRYRTLLPAMIADWRARFGQGDVPFLIVSLANFQPRRPTPRESAWAEMRESQALAARSVPKAGLVITIDIGDAKDIHPMNKQEVGRRLALAAESIAYGQTVDFSGPWYRAMQVDGAAIRLRFDHAEGLKTVDGAAPVGFAIAGEDRAFVWAETRIDGDTVFVSSPQVPKPVAVRYAWQDNPACNLTNRSGLPAVPFRTDQWPGVTWPTSETP
jgi:sialate O-acetylesterase